MGKRLSEATDVYSLGRIIRKANRVVLHSNEVTALAKKTMQYNSSKRPCITDTVRQLNT